MEMVTCHLLLHCFNFSDEKLAFLLMVLYYNETMLILLFGNTSFDKTSNTLMLEATMDNFVVSGRFESHYLIFLNEMNCVFLSDDNLNQYGYCYGYTLCNFHCISFGLFGKFTYFLSFFYYRLL